VLGLNVSSSELLPFRFDPKIFGRIDFIQTRKRVKKNAPYPYTQTQEKCNAWKKKSIII